MDHSSIDPLMMGERESSHELCIEMVRCINQGAVPRESERNSPKAVYNLWKPLSSIQCYLRSMELHTKILKTYMALLLKWVNFISQNGYLITWSVKCGKNSLTVYLFFSCLISCFICLYRKCLFTLPSNEKSYLISYSKLFRLQTSHPGSWLGHRVENSRSPFIDSFWKI